VGLAALVTRATRLGTPAFLAAAEALAVQATAEEQAAGLLFPRFSRIADVSAAVAAAVAAALVADGAGTLPEGVAYAGAGGGRSLPPGVTPLEAFIRSRMVNLPAPARL
jgi:malic enzyme